MLMQQEQNNNNNQKLYRLVYSEMCKLQRHVSLFLLVCLCEWVQGCTEECVLDFIVSQEEQQLSFYL